MTIDTILLKLGTKVENERAQERQLQNYITNVYVKERLENRSINDDVQIDNKNELHTRIML